MWPILGYFTNIICDGNPNIFIIGAYYGKSKPSDCNEFLNDFVTALKVLNSVGVTINPFIVTIKDKNIKVYLKTLICDAPAKAFILNIKNHNGKHSCIKCLSIGKWTNNRVYFPDIDSPMRSHENFVLYKDSNFHCGKTILTEVPDIDFVNSIPFEYMHCVCIGVMKKLLLFWIGLPKHKQTLPTNLITILEKNFSY